jgi:hypothetical protein
VTEESSSSEVSVSPPLEGDEVPADLTDHLWHLRRIALEKKALTEQYEVHKAKALALLGDHSALTVDPYTGEKLVAARRADEILDVDYDALCEAVGLPMANALCKQPQIDKTRFEDAVARGLIPLDVVSRVARWKPKAAFVSFTKPDDEA